MFLPPVRQLREYRFGVSWLAGFAVQILPCVVCQEYTVDLTLDTVFQFFAVDTEHTELICRVLPSQLGAHAEAYLEQDALLDEKQFSG